jgi:hypothetical protein
MAGCVFTIVLTDRKVVALKLVGINLRRARRKGTIGDEMFGSVERIERALFILLVNQLPEDWSLVRFRSELVKAFEPAGEAVRIALRNWHASEIVRLAKRRWPGFGGCGTP